MYWYNHTTRHHITVPPRCGGTTARQVLDRHPDWSTGNTEQAKQEAERCTIWYKTPFDRWRSWYCQFIIGGHITPLWRSVIAQEDASLFDEKDLSVFTMKFLDMFEKYFWVDTHTIPQSQWVIFDRTFYKQAQFEFVHNNDLNNWLAGEHLSVPAHRNSSQQSVWMEIDFAVRMKCAERIVVLYQSDATFLPATAVPQNISTK